MAKGDGTFQPPIAVPTGPISTTWPRGTWTATAFLDIIGSSTGYGGTIFVYKDMGGGVYSASGSYSGGLGAFNVDLADFNHDGKLDLVEADTLTNDVRTYQNNGDGTFGLGRSFTTGTAVTRLTVGDLNRDGNPDIDRGRRHHVHPAGEPRRHLPGPRPLHRGDRPERHSGRRLQSRRQPRPRRVQWAGRNRSGRRHVLRREPDAGRPR